MGRKEEKSDDPGPYHLSNDRDLNEVWPEVIAEYERVTEKKLDCNTTFESFQLTVNQRLREATSKRSSNARAILNNVGQCLEQFGSIIAGGTSTVFGPSAQCWSAINFVLIAAQKYSEVFDGFITLMERCAAFLSRLNMFLEQKITKQGSYLPKHLRKPAYDILVHFIEILKSSYKLSTSKREKFKLVLEIVLFSGDAGVKSSLELLEQQVQDFTNTQVTQILVDVRGLARHLEKSEEDLRHHHKEIREHLEHVCEVVEETRAITQQVKITLDGRMTQEKNKEDLDKIRRAFGLKSGEEPWVKRHDHLCKSRVDKSGRWLEDREDLGFIAWADVLGHSQGKILTVEGDSGFGKSFISNKIIAYLQDKYRTSKSSPDRVSVAYYYFGDHVAAGEPSTSRGKVLVRKNDYDDKEDSLEKCLRAIIYQFASRDPTYARAVAEACQQPASIARAKDMWECLIVQLQSAMKGTYYICMDGFDNRGATGNGEETMTIIAQHILSEFKGISIRLYFSGTNDVAKSIPQDDRVRRILLGPIKDPGRTMGRASANEITEPSISIPLVNARDLQAVASIRAERMGEKKPDLKTLLTEEKIKKLVAGVRGHYDLLEVKLTQINACDTEQKIQEVIDSVGDDLTASIRSSLKVFCASLSAEHIQQLNELLIWVVGGKTSDVSLLQSVLYLAFRKNFMLRDMISTVFSGLLILSEDKVQLKSDQALQILREENASHFKISRSDSTATELSQAEINLCSEIIKNVCGSQVYGKFKFDDFFDSLAGKHRAFVHIDDDNALNVAITRSSLQALCESKEDKSLERLRIHASIYFYEYLHGFVENLDFFEPDKESLTAIGGALSQILFHPEDFVHLWFDNNLEGWIRNDLLVGEKYLDSILKILRNPHAALGYAQDEEKKKWVQTVTSSKSDKHAVLEKVANYLVTTWFKCNTLLSKQYYFLPLAIFLKVLASTYFCFLADLLLTEERST
jgi:hypothetical protein